MKKFSVNCAGIAVAAVLVSLFLISGRVLASASVEQPLKIGDILNIPGLGLKPNSYADDIISSDVTGDGVDDTVILAGTKESQEGIYSFEHTVIVQDGALKKYTVLSRDLDGGYEGKLFAGDFNGDKVPDIMTSAATGGSGGTYVFSLVSFAGGNIKVLVPQDVLSVGARFSGFLKDGFKAEIKSIDLDKTVDIDINNDKNDYIENNIYDSTGKLLEKTELSTDGFGLLKPVDYDNDGIYELEGVQRIWGFCHVNTISDAKTLWKFENNVLQLQSIELSTFIHK